MSIHSPIRFVNPIIRNLIDHPSYWNDVWEILVPRYGQFFEPCSSYYSFYEYFALKELDIKVTDQIAFQDIKSKERAEKEINTIGSTLDNYIIQTMQDIKNQLLNKKCELLRLICKRKKREESFEGSQDLRDILFRYFLDLISNDYDQFVEQSAWFLGWDHFCSINPSGISQELLGEVQLGVWNQSREKGMLLPLGKLIDKLAKKFGIKLEAKSPFKGSLNDLVDSEAVTNLVMGPKREVFLTYDDLPSVKQRIDLAIKVIVALEKIQKITIKKNLGMVYWLTRPTKQNEKIEIIDYYEPSIPINL